MIFLRINAARETQVGFSFVQTTLDPYVYKIVEVPEKEDSSLESDPGVDDGGESVGIMSTNVDDPPPVADDRTREMVGSALGFRR